MTDAEGLKNAGLKAADRQEETKDNPDEKERNQQNSQRMGLKKGDFVLDWADGQAGMKDEAKNIGQSNFSNAERIRNFMRAIRFDDFEKKRMQQFPPNHGLHQLLNDLSSQNKHKMKKFIKLKTISSIPREKCSPKFCSFNCLDDDDLSGTRYIKEEEDDEDYEEEDDDEEEERNEGEGEEDGDISGQGFFKQHKDSYNKSDSKIYGSSQMKWKNQSSSCPSETMITDMKNGLIEMQELLAAKLQKQMEAQFDMQSLKFMEKRTQSTILQLKKKMYALEQIEDTVEKRSGFLESEVNKVKLQKKLVKFKQEQLTSEINEKDNKNSQALRQKEIVQLEMEKDLLDIIKQFEKFTSREQQVTAILRSQNKQLEVLQKQHLHKQRLKAKQATQMNLVDKINQLIAVKEFLDLIDVTDSSLNEDIQLKDLTNGTLNAEKSNGQDEQIKVQEDTTAFNSREETQGKEKNNLTQGKEDKKELDGLKVELRKDAGESNILTDKRDPIVSQQQNDEEHDEQLLLEKQSKQHTEEQQTQQQQGKQQLFSSQMQDLNQSSFMANQQGFHMSSTLAHTIDAVSPSLFAASANQSNQAPHIIESSMQNAPQTLLKQEPSMLPSIEEKPLKQKQPKEASKENELQHERIMAFLDSIKENTSGFFDKLVKKHKLLQIRLGDWQIKQTVMRQLRDDRLKELKELEAVPIDTSEVSLFRKAKEVEEETTETFDNPENQKQETTCNQLINMNPLEPFDVDNLTDVIEYRKKMIERQQLKKDEIYKFERTHQVYSLDKLQAILSFDQQHLKAIHFKLVRFLSNLLDRLPTKQIPALSYASTCIEDLLTKANQIQSSINEKSNALFFKDIERLKNEMASSDSLKLDLMQRQTLAEVLCQPAHLYTSLTALLKFFFPFAPEMQNIFIREFKFGFHLLRYCTKTDIVEYSLGIYNTLSKSELFTSLYSDSSHPFQQSRRQYIQSQQQMHLNKNSTKQKQIQTNTPIQEEQINNKTNKQDEYMKNREEDKKELEEIAILEMFASFPSLVDKATKSLIEYVFERINIAINIIKQINSLTQQLISTLHLPKKNPHNLEGTGTSLGAGFNSKNNLSSQVRDSLARRSQQEQRNRLFPLAAKEKALRYTDFTYGQNQKTDGEQQVLPLQMYTKAQVKKLDQQRGFYKAEAKESLLTIEKDYVMKKKPSIVNIQDLVKEQIYMLHYQSSPSVINLAEECAVFNDLRDNVKVELSVLENQEKQRIQEEQRLLEEELKKTQKKKRQEGHHQNGSERHVTNNGNNLSNPDYAQTSEVFQEIEQDGQIKSGNLEQGSNSPPGTQEHSGLHLQQKLKAILRLNKTLQAFAKKPIPEEESNGENKSKKKSILNDTTPMNETVQITSYNKVVSGNGIVLKNLNSSGGKLLKSQARSQSPPSKKIHQYEDQDKKEFANQLKTIVHYQLDFKKAKSNAIERRNQELQQQLILEGELAYKTNPSPHLPHEGSGKPQSPPGRTTNPALNNNFMPTPLKIPAAALNTNEKANKVIKKGFLSYFRRKQYDQYRQLEEQFAQLFQHSDNYFAKSKQNQFNLSAEDTRFHYLAHENLSTPQESCLPIIQQPTIIQSKLDRKDSLPIKFLGTNKMFYQRGSFVDDSSNGSPRLNGLSPDSSNSKIQYARGQNLDTFSQTIIEKRPSSNGIKAVKLKQLSSFANEEKEQGNQEESMSPLIRPKQISLRSPAIPGNSKNSLDSLSDSNQNSQTNVSPKNKNRSSKFGKLDAIDLQEIVPQSVSTKNSLPNQKKNLKKKN